jgi:hypothetical protein
LFAIVLEAGEYKFKAVTSGKGLLTGSSHQMTEYGRARAQKKAKLPLFFLQCIGIKPPHARKALYH